MSNWQDLLWRLPNHFGYWWEIGVSSIALFTALLLFLKLIMGHAFDAILFARSVVGLGLVMVGMTPLNSGWNRISVAVLVVGLFISTILIVTGWCDREDKSLTIPKALWRTTKKAPGNFMTYLAGPKRRYDPAEHV
jgi:hypothetical protein